MKNKKHPKNKYAKDLRTPKYKKRIIPDKRKKLSLSKFSLGNWWKSLMTGDVHCD